VEISVQTTESPQDLQNAPQPPPNIKEKGDHLSAADEKNIRDEFKLALCLQAGYLALFVLTFIWAAMSSCYALRQFFLLAYFPTILSAFFLLLAFSWGKTPRLFLNTLSGPSVMLFKLTAMIMAGCAPFLSWELAYLEHNGNSAHFSICCFFWEIAFLLHLLKLPRFLLMDAIIKNSVQSSWKCTAHLATWVKFFLVVPAIAVFFAYLVSIMQEPIPGNSHGTVEAILGSPLADFVFCLWNSPRLSLIHFFLLSVTSFLFIMHNIRLFFNLDFSLFSDKPSTN